MSTYSVYHLVDPDTGLVRYVGKSTGPQSRLQQHLAESRARQNTAKKLWIYSLLKAGKAPVLVIVQGHAHESDARERESQECRKHAATILNIHDPAKGAKDFRPRPFPSKLSTA